MKRFRVIVEPQALSDIECYYLRALAAGAGRSAVRWYDRIVEAIQALRSRR